MKFLRKVYPMEGLQWTGDNLEAFLARPEVIRAERYTPVPGNLIVRTKAPRGFAQSEISTHLGKGSWLLFDKDGFTHQVHEATLAADYEEVK